MSCKYACTTWGVGLEIDAEVSREQVAELAKEMLEEDNRKELRNKAVEWKKNAKIAVAPGGSSSRDFERLVLELQKLSSRGRLTN